MRSASAHRRCACCRNLGELFRGLSGIDQTRLFKWSGEALTLAIKPFRGALSAILPGMRGS